MNIGFDAKRLFLNHSGLGNYSRNLLEALAEFYPQNTYQLFSPKISNEFNQFFNPPFHPVIPEKKLHQFFPAIWRSKGIIQQVQQSGINVFHGLSNELPFTISKFKGRKIVTIHDLIFIRYPQYYKSIDRKIYTKKVSTACQMADVVIAISSQTKSDLIEFLKVDESKIVVHGQSCQKLFWELKNHQFSHMNFSSTLPENYLLYVGTVEPRKNLLKLVEAIKSIDMPLVVVGRLTKDYGKSVLEYVERNNLGSKVVFLKNVTNHELSYLYQKAEALIYPSEFEGFGLPVLEAMVSGCPVITGNNSSLTEVGGNAAEYINVDDLESYTRTIEIVLGDVEKQKSMSQKGVIQSNMFSRRHWAEKTFKIYQH